MKRTQIQFDEEQTEFLHRVAAARGVSMSTVVREAVARYVAAGADPAEIRKRALSAVGKGRSGKRDIAENHDKYLEEAYLDWQSS